jgi:hypothetical protein
VRTKNNEGDPRFCDTKNIPVYWQLSADVGARVRAGRLAAAWGEWGVILARDARPRDDTCFRRFFVPRNTRGGAISALLGKDKVFRNTTWHF